MGIEPNRARIEENLRRSLMLVTALNPHIGYDNAAKIAKKAHKHALSLREAALALGVDADVFDATVRPADMTHPGVADSTTAHLVVSATEPWCAFSRFVPAGRDTGPVFIASGPLYTERLILRAFRDSDLDDIARFEARPDVIRYLDRVAAEDREGLRERLTRRAWRRTGSRLRATPMTLAVERQDSGAVIGYVTLSWASTEHMQGEIGFVSTPSSRAGDSPRRPRRSCCRSGTSAGQHGSSAWPTPATPGPSR